MIRPLRCLGIPLHGRAVFALVIDRGGNRSKPQSGTIPIENTMSEITPDTGDHCDLERLDNFTIRGRVFEVTCPHFLHQGL